MTGPMTIFEINKMYRKLMISQNKEKRTVTDEQVAEGLGVLSDDALFGIHRECLDNESWLPFLGEGNGIELLEINTEIRRRGLRVVM